jgi:hypothetical protein
MEIEAFVILRVLGGETWQIDALPNAWEGPVLSSLTTVLTVLDCSGIHCNVAALQRVWGKSSARPGSGLDSRFMVTHCANDKCCAHLHSFSEGRLFQFEVVSVSMSAVDVVSRDSDENPRRETAQFWLCGSCAETMTLLLEPVRGLRLVPWGAEVPSSGSDGTMRAANHC